MNSLEGKSIDCHQCKGEAVWVDLGERVGRYHYCRVCKIETGPFAKSAAASEEQVEFPFMDTGSGVFMAPSTDDVVRFYVKGRWV